MATSRRCSSARISGAVAVQAERSVAAVIKALLAAVVLRLLAPATLASVAASSEGPNSSDRMEEWPLLSHLAYTLCMACDRPHTSLTVVPQQFIGLLVGALSSLASISPYKSPQYNLIAPRTSKGAAKLNASCQ